MAKPIQKAQKRVRETARKGRKQAAGGSSQGYQGHHPPDELGSPKSSSSIGTPGGVDQSIWNLGIPGLPPDIAARVAEFLKNDPTGDSAIRYIRTTPWYATEYAGIQEGIAKQLFDPQGNPERDYRNWKTSIIDTYKRYYGRIPTVQEITSMATNGYKAEVVEQQGQGHAWAGVHGADSQWASGAFGGGQLSPEELKALGEQQSGIQTTLGASIQAKVESALAKASKAFEGVQGSSVGLDTSLSETVQKKRQKGLAA